MTGISATVICDSISTHSPRLTSFAVRFHQFVLAGRNTHRAFSRSDRSTRAVLFERLAAEVRADPAMPVEFLKAKKGMGGGEPMTGNDLEQAKTRWAISASRALEDAEIAHHFGEARESVNARILPYIYTNSIITSCEDGLLNFFGLRLDSHARPEIRVLAEKMWVAWNSSKPKQLEPGQWHLPLIDGESYQQIHEWSYKNEPAEYCSPRAMDLMKMVSAARCARQSFSYNKTHTIEEDLALYERLINDRHYGPLEHQATPDDWNLVVEEAYGCGWINPQYHGNFPSYVQFRKLIHGENIAPLPSGYVYNDPRAEP